MAGNLNINTRPKLQTRQRLESWFRTDLGKAVLTLEQQYLEEELATLFGYHVLQVGRTDEVNLLNGSRISHQVLLDYFEHGATLQQSRLVATSQSIPIESDSMDVVVLPHVLEFESSPHQLLREAQRILIGEGHIVIVGFNPYSLWGLWRLLLAWREEPPWSGKFIGTPRLRDWLTLLDFEITQTQHFYFRPPLKSQKFQQKLGFMEKLGKYIWPYLGGIYLIVAKKRVVPLTPVKMRWHERRRLITSGVVEPSARIHNHRQNN